MQNTYPLWKNILLVILAVIAIVYSIPNFYGEEPVIQISTETAVDPHAILKQTQEMLDKDSVPYQSIKTHGDGVEVRFASTDQQLQARDVVATGLGQNYIVALTLAPTTPKWLSAIYAEPMKQGLDLRGGVHFLLEVDMDSVMNRRYEGFLKSIGQELREEAIRYSGIRYYPQQGITIRLRSEEMAQQTVTVLSSKYNTLTFAISKKDQRAVIATLSSVERHDIRQSTIDQTMGILRNRVNELGVGEAVVVQQGATRIGVDLPGIQDAARAKQILGGTATLQFYMVDQDNDPVIAAKTGAIPPGSKLLHTKSMNPILLKRQVVLSGDSITSATSSFDQQTASHAVQIQLGGGGEAMFSKITRENVGKSMAIVFVESKTSEQNVNGVLEHKTTRDERVISVAAILSALGNNFQITGLSDSKEASNLALLLRAGALPAAIYPVEERTVGPTLGKENIKRGIFSLEVGLGLILILMVLYYRLFGLIADVALVLNLTFLLALLSMLGATLTLPGIAGIVLTVGMAVDANVLIDERIREELRHGLSPQAAIYAGYERAFSTILDANITTLIVAIVLFSIGSGPVRGFAVTLSLGLITSMITGITYTRAVVNWIYGRRSVKRLSIGI
ncbi:MAG: protein translocase subunit SecD [Gammaproteobacteria bacterium]|nr:protein translocase subunit SecD [Gammaproteobacteria bacterium]